MYRKRQLYQSQVGWRKSKDEKAKRIATRGEQLAVEFLESKSYIVLARNYRAGRSGEIDIVARSQDGILVFVEVKTRTITETVYGIPEFGFEAVGYKKQRRIAAVSRAFIGENFEKVRWRFDVIVVGIHLDSPEGTGEDFPDRANQTQPNRFERIEISHVENAFF